MFKPSRIKYDILLNTRRQSSSQSGPIGPEGNIGPTGSTGPKGSEARFSIFLRTPTVLTNQYIALTIDGVTYNVVSVSVPRALNEEENEEE